MQHQLLHKLAVTKKMASLCNKTDAKTARSIMNSFIFNTINFNIGRIVITAIC